ncbi:hypothetical protein [Streptomyces sp. KL116D]|uniref:hypothetical protein n=1 Tax=Streptomyces sp. KL116D TaxID=3045152 RepID=UPI003559314F
MENATEVTAAGIARLAEGRTGRGQQLAATARRLQAGGRHRDQPSFALAEVEERLRAGRKLAEVPLRERVWQRSSPATRARSPRCCTPEPSSCSSTTAPRSGSR